MSDTDGAGHPALEEDEGMHPAGAAAPRSLEGGHGSHQTFLSAQICRSGRTVSGPNLVTDQAVSSPCWWYFPGERREGKTYSTPGGHQPKFLTHGAPAPGVWLIQVTGLWIAHSRTCRNRVPTRDPKEGGIKGKMPENPEIVSRDSSMSPIFGALIMCFPVEGVAL